MHLWWEIKNVKKTKWDKYYEFYYIMIRAPLIILVNQKSEVKPEKSNPNNLQKGSWKAKPSQKLKVYYEIVNEAHPLSGFVPTDADCFTEMHF